MFMETLEGYLGQKAANYRIHRILDQMVRKEGADLRTVRAGNQGESAKPVQETYPFQDREMLAVAEGEANQAEASPLVPGKTESQGSQGRVPVSYDQKMDSHQH